MEVVGAVVAVAVAEVEADLDHMEDSEDILEAAHNLAVGSQAVGIQHKEEVPNLVGHHHSLRLC